MMNGRKSQSMHDESFKLKFMLKQAKEDTEFQELIRDRWYIMEVDNRCMFYWDIFVIMLAIYNAIALPL